MDFSNTKDIFEKEFASKIIESIPSYSKLWSYIGVDLTRSQGILTPQPVQWQLKDVYKKFETNLNEDLETFWFSAYSAMISWVHANLKKKEIEEIYDSFRIGVNEKESRIKMRFLEEEYWQAMGMIYYRIGASSVYYNHFLNDIEKRLDIDNRSKKPIPNIEKFLGLAGVQIENKSKIERVIKLRGLLVHRTINFGKIDHNQILILDPFKLQSLDGGIPMKFENLPFSDKLGVLERSMDIFTKFLEQWLFVAQKLIGDLENKIRKKKEMTLTSTTKTTHVPELLFQSGSARPSEPIEKEE